MDDSIVPGDVEVRGGRSSNRMLVLLGSLILNLAAGSVYVFGAYSGSLKASGLSQQNVQLVSSLGNLKVVNTVVTISTTGISAERRRMLTLVCPELSTPFEI